MKREFKYFKQARKNCNYISSSKVVCISDMHLGAGTYDDEAMKNNSLRERDDRLSQQIL